MGKIRGLRWHTGTVLPESVRPDTLSAREMDYFHKYNDLISEYNTSVDVDLTADVEVC